MALSSMAVAKAKPRGRQQKLADGHGLHLLVTPQGGRCWRMNYRFEGKWRTLPWARRRQLPGSPRHGLRKSR
ncbi:Arm DNA-binding domain-containing protein [Sphingomonas sp. LaA6.9]|uniref:Arm DNA-binding domain-containing protein n=1 Tax=Sphingomonas sp. LaA6.9 TaxID=2919914 RepID=UPI0032AF7D00